MVFIIAAFLLCLVIALLMNASRTNDTNNEVPVSKPKRQRKQKVKSYEEHVKRMNKKKYLSEHSEYVYISIPEARDIVGVGDNELLESIIEATLDGKDFIKVKRETYNKIKDNRWKSTTE